MTTCQTVVAASLRGHDPPAQRRSDISYSVARLIPGQGVRPGIVALEAAGEGSCSAVNARVLVPWKSISDALGDTGGLAGGSLTVEVFTGDAPGPDDLGDVVFFTVLTTVRSAPSRSRACPGSGLSRRSRPGTTTWPLLSPAA